MMIEKGVPMSTTTMSNVLLAGPAFLARMGNRFAALLDGLDEARQMAERFRTLSRMSDAELSQHGLTREDIPQACLNFRHAA
jgi:uncharacterized protein YjiS (DUF1127 family)